VQVDRHDIRDAAHAGIAAGEDATGGGTSTKSDDRLVKKLEL